MILVEDAVGIFYTQTDECLYSLFAAYIAITPPKSKTIFFIIFSYSLAVVIYSQALAIYPAMQRMCVATGYRSAVSVPVILVREDKQLCRNTS